jgi:transcription termination/antitermination protein NusG
MSNYKWYTLRAVSGKEHKAKEYLEAELRLHPGMPERVSQILIPEEKIMVVKNGKKVIKARNSLPGYIIIEADLTTSTPQLPVADVISAIESVPNVIYFINKGAPIAMRDSEVKRILGKLDEIVDAGETMENRYVIGENVKVTDGPFNEFTGVIEEIHEEKKKLKVMVKIFGRRTPLELAYTQVEKI